MCRLLCVLLLLFAVDMGRAAPVITEFMADNDGILKDEDGDYSDWLEIHNPDPEPLNLEGWYLTDSASNLRKWQFPEVTIPPGGYLVVFASNKNRRVPGGELHTNFALSASGEYLGLIMPDGVTRVSEYAPEFPAQYRDISYGIAAPTVTVTLVAPNSPVKAFVPTNATLGTTWRQREFDDSGWLTGPQAVGFSNYGKTSNPDVSALLGLDIKSQMAGKATSAYVRLVFDIEDPAKVRQLKLRVNYDDGFAAFLNGGFAVSRNSPPWGTLAYNSLAQGVRNPTETEEFDLSGQVQNLVAGTNVLAFQLLNESITSSDVYLLAEVRAVVESDDVEPMVGYFSVATPGARNGGPDTLRLPQTVAVSRAPGTFTAPFNLTLSGAAAGQQIRYVMVAPSSNPGANIPDPTLSSTLYTGPISISASRLIRAAVFDPVTGQKGATTTVQYLLLETGSNNNTSNFTSTLPIAVLDSHGGGAPDASTYKTAILHLFEPTGGPASLSATPSLSTRAGFRVRGSSSANFPKKSYRMETWDEWNEDASHSLLGMAADGDWILTGTWGYDDTHIHNAFVFELSRRMGWWAPRTRFVEMFVNTNGGKLDYTDYAGIYTLTERIESDKDRLDIESIGPQDNAGDALTGGYIFKIDRSDPDEVSWRTNRGIPNPESGQSLVMVEPDADDATDEQVAYLKGLVQTFEDTLHSERSAGFATRNYRRFIDVPAWIDHHVLSTLVYDVDGLRLSAFFHKDRNGKIKAGPVWDFDRSLGSDDGRDQNPRSWNAIEYFFTRDWWGYLFQDAEFVQEWVDRWWELRGDIFSNENLEALADTLGAQIGNTIGARDAARWPGSGSGGNTFVSGSHSGEIARMKTWLISTTPGNLGRAPWLDTRIPGPPSASLESGVVPAGTTVTLSGSNTIHYRLDGTDPRPYGGSTATTAPVYSEPITINQTTVLRARRKGNYAPFPVAVVTNWSAPLLRVYLVDEVFAVAGDVAISEIHFRPTEPTPAEREALFEPTAQDFEFIELRNVGNRTVNTFEMVLTDGVGGGSGVTLAPLTLKPGEIALVVRDRSAFEARYGTGMSDRIIGEWKEGALSDSGETLRILARDGSVVQTMTYSTDGVPEGASVNLVEGQWISEAPSPGTYGPTFDQWTKYHFPAGGEVGDRDADPDEDHASNWREYARGTEPLVAEDEREYEPTFDWIVDGDGSVFRLTYKRPVNRPDATYQPQKSEDLKLWEPVSDERVSVQGTVETRKVEIPVTDPQLPQRLFLRLETTVAE